MDLKKLMGRQEPEETEHKPVSPPPIPSQEKIELVGMPEGIRIDERTHPEDPLPAALDAIGEGAPCLICLTYLDGEVWRHVVTARDFPTGMLPVAFREYRRQRASELGE